MLILLSELAQGYGRPSTSRRKAGGGRGAAPATSEPVGTRHQWPQRRTVGPATDYDRKRAGLEQGEAGAQSRNHADCDGVVEGDDRVVVQPEQDAVERGDLRPIRRQDTPCALINRGVLE
jgi:hypothetical protein